MEDPLAGLRSIYDCLKQGGLMKIALYSAMARQHIVKIRDEIKNHSIKSDHESMRIFRSKLLNSREKHHMKVCLSNDFFYNSTISIMRKFYSSFI